MRTPVVAGRFYPGSPTELAETVSELFAKAGTVQKEKALAVVSPHAGYIYSGELAAKTLSRIIIPETVVIIGPNHHGRGAQVALSAQSWEMPFGVVPVDQEMAALLVEHGTGDITIDETAHDPEHSLEVQIPFLQKLQDRLTIVPLIVSQITFSQCEEVAKSLADAIQRLNKDILIVASSDMSHYESRGTATKKDRLALQDVENLHPQELYNTVFNNRISMCGVIPVVITLLTARLMGATRADLVDYTDSGYVSGDTKQVVGYAGFVIR